MLKIYDFEIEYQQNPLGLDEKAPAFSWKMDSSNTDVVQKSYSINVYEDQSLVWESGPVESDQSLYIEYQGQELKAQTEYRVELEVTDNYDQTACAQGTFETGLLSYENFQADWITHQYEDQEEACAVYVKAFDTDKKVIRARAYISALGIYKVDLNGQRVGDAFFAPGWTAYQERLQYQTYDLTELIKKENEIRITVGNGWFKGILGFYGQGNHYGTRTAMIAMIDIWYEDGSCKRISTDADWGCTTGEHRYNDIYNGEVIDKSLDTQEILPVKPFEYAKNILVGQENVPVRITERIPAKELIITPEGETVIDFGQNMSAIVELKINRPKGTKITIRHAEALDENGNLFTTNLRSARATDVYITSGQDDVFLPEFTFHGFRYIGIDGLDQIDISNFTACVLHSELKQTSTFTSSNSDVNQLMSNIDWTMRSNYFDIPMDCPQRNERLGYTGDCEIFLPTACYLRNVAQFYRKWLRDLRVEQGPTGAVYLTVPDILKTYTCVQIWHEAATIVPWNIYKTYGDARLLTEQYDSMKLSVDYTKSLAGEGGLLNGSNSSQFGDWLALDYQKGPFRQIPEGILDPSNDEKGGGTDSYFVGNIYYLHSIDIMRQTAEVLGKADDAVYFQKLYDQVLELIRQEYVTANGRLVTETQTAYALALYFNIVKEEHRAGLLDRLELNLIKNKKHLSTGFVGTEYIMKTLSENGHHKMAGNILLKDDCPSWLYSIRLGATTVWELWDGVNPDGSFNMFEMNSLNQYGFATIGEWVYGELCGIRSLEAGYKRFIVAPKPVVGVPEFEAGLETVYGKIECKFSCKNGRVNAQIKVPANTSAVIALPEQEEITVGSGTYTYSYETDSSYELKEFDEDTILNVLRSYPEAEEIFMREAPDLANSGFVRGFAGGLSILEIRKTLPPTLVPERAFAIFEKMIDTLNNK